MKLTTSTWQVREKLNELVSFSAERQEKVVRVKFKVGAVVDRESFLDAEASILLNSTDSRAATLNIDNKQRNMISSQPSGSCAREVELEPIPVGLNCSCSL